MIDKLSCCRVANAIRFFYPGSDVGELDELYWNVTGNSWTMPIDKAHARVVLPSGVSPTPTADYTGIGRSIATDAAIQKDGNEVEDTGPNGSGSDRGSA